jgi:hypothetical protein
MAARRPSAERRQGVRALWAARLSHGSSGAGWRQRARQAPSCARAPASAGSGECWVSGASRWCACAVARADGRRTSPGARRGVSGRRGAPVTSASGGVLPRCRGAHPWAWRLRRPSRATIPDWPRPPGRRMARTRGEPCRQPRCPPARRVALDGARRLRPAAVPRWALRKGRALELPRHGAPPAPARGRHGLQGPARPMAHPDLRVVGPSPGPPSGGEGRGPCGRRRGRAWHRGEARNRGGVCGIVHGRRRTGRPGTDTRPLGGIGPEDAGEHGRERRQPGPPLRHRARPGRPAARPLCGPRCTLPHEPLHPGLRLQPRRHGSGLPVGGQGHGPPPCKRQQEGAAGVARPPRAIGRAADLRRDERGAGGATAHPPPGGPTDEEASRLAQPNPGRSTRGAASGEEECRPSPRPPRPGRHTPRPSLRAEAA